MGRVLACAAVVLCVVAEPTLGQPIETRLHRQFLAALSGFNQAQIQFCLAAEKAAESQAVKDFARRVIDDDSKLQVEIDKVTGDNQIAVEPQMVQQALAKLQPRSVFDFDSAFMAAQVNYYTNEVIRLEGAQRSGEEAIRQLASDLLPVRREHLASARTVCLSVIGNPANLSNAGEACATQSRIDKPPVLSRVNRRR